MSKNQWSKKDCLTEKWLLGDKGQQDQGIVPVIDQPM
jgi:hypothetical protein